MSIHTLLSLSDREVPVAPPVPGQVLVANAAGAWQAMTLENQPGLFGTPGTLVAALPTLATTAPGTPDYVIQDVTSTLPFGFADAEEARTVLSVLVNVQARVAALEAKLVALGMMA